MAKNKLIPYNIRIKKTDTAGWLQLDDLTGYKQDLLESRERTDRSQIPFTPEEQQKLDDNDLFHILEDFFTTKQEQATKVFKESQKTTTIIRHELEDRDIYGIIKSGEYGFGADFYNIESKTRKNNARSPDDSEEYPFFFHFRIPVGQNDGRLILQTIGVHGIATVLQRYLNEYLEPKGYVVVFNRVITTDFIDQLGGDRPLKEIRFIKKVVSQDVAEKIHTGESEDLIESRVFSTRKKRALSLTSSLKEILKNQNVTSYEILNEEYSEVKAIFTDSGSRRTLKLGFDKNQLGEVLILRKDIHKEKDGHPTFGVLLSESKKYLKNLAGDEDT